MKKIIFILLWVCTAAFSDSMPQQLSCSIQAGAPQCMIPYQTQKYFSITEYSGKQKSGIYIFSHAKTFGDALYPQDNVAYQYCRNKNCEYFVLLTASIPLIQADINNIHWIKVNKKFEPYVCHSSQAMNCPYTNVPYFAHSGVSLYRSFAL